MRLPEGYARMVGPAGTAFAVEEMRRWVHLALAGETLHDRASREAGETLAGRGPVYVVDVAGRPRAVRHYYRGGAVARLLEDRYLRLGVPRPIRELRASEEARRRGVPTPRVLAGAVYPAGPFYRADLVTDYVPRGRDLGSVVLGADEGQGARAALEAAGALVARMAAAGVRHPDLNARNVLLISSDDGLEALLLDLDRCTVAPPGARAPARPMVERLERSLAKLAGAAGGPGPSERTLAALRDASRADLPSQPRKPG